MRVDPGRIGQTVVVVGCRDLESGKPPVKLGDDDLGIFCKNENAMLFRQDRSPISSGF